MAQQALAEIEQHKANCGERYQAIDTRLKDVKSAVETQRTETKESFSKLHDRVDRGIGGFYKILLSTAGAVIIALLGLIGTIIVEKM